MKYDWREYYRQAYEKEKKRNTVLAGRVADAEAKRDELRGKLTAICGNPLYRMMKPFSLVKRGCRKAVRKTGELFRGNEKQGGILQEGDGGEENGVKASPEELLASYQERLDRQKDGYGQWIREVEPVLWKQRKEALHAGMKERRTCRVVSYRELAGITDLSQIKSLKEAGDTDIVLFAEDPEDLDERAVSYIEDWFSAHGETKLLYGAEDHQTVDGKRRFPWFKPCWSTDTLLGFFYFGSYFAVDFSWAKETHLSGDEDAKKNLYDFVLWLLKPYFERKQISERKENRKMQENNAFSCGENSEMQREKALGNAIVCSDLVLYHRSGTVDFEVQADGEYFLHTGEMHEEVNFEYWGYQKRYTEIKGKFIDNICYFNKDIPDENGGRNLRKNSDSYLYGVKRAKTSFIYQTMHPSVWSVVPDIDTGRGRQGGILVSVVIPSKDHPELLKKCIGSFLERTYLPGLEQAVEFIVVDNGSSEENSQTIEAFLESLKTECHYLYQPMEFNFSAMCNLGAGKAKGEYILLLNDDMEIIEENWLRILLGQALMPGTGAVGAKLWYPEGERIQHAGITNMHIGPSHKLVTFPDDRTYYYGHNTLTYDMIAVTAACLLVRKDIYREVGGLDEEMAVSYNDVDLCFKLAEAGYRNVVRNDAVLLHHESASRGSDEVSDEKWQRLLREKTKLYKKHPLFYKYDPYYSEQLADNAPDYRIGYEYPYERLLLTAEAVRREGKGVLQKMRSGSVMLTVERTGRQHKIHLEEPDILETEGWCYMLGQDNCLFERWVVFEAEQEDFYYQIPVKERRRPDVEAILPLQKNVELSGFVCRVLKEDIAAGSYRVGMLYKNLSSGRMLYQCSDKVVKNFFQR